MVKENIYKIILESLSKHRIKLEILNLLEDGRKMNLLQIHKVVGTDYTNVEYHVKDLMKLKILKGKKECNERGQPHYVWRVK